MKIEYVSYIRSEYDTAVSLTTIKTNSILLPSNESSILDRRIQNWSVRGKNEIQLSKKGIDN